jgi:hypothetical protein
MVRLANSTRFILWRVPWLIFNVGCHRTQRATSASGGPHNRRIANGEQARRVAGLAMRGSRQWISPATGSGT